MTVSSGTAATSAIHPPLVMNTSSPSLARAPAHGKGKAVLRSLADEATFSELSYRYPLKLLSPRTHATPSGVPVAIAYMLSYGGGLVSGDSIELDVDVGSNSSLMLLTQGSTKIFKTRARPTQSALGNNATHSSNSTPSSSTITTQKLNAVIQPSGALILLPDPVTCFASSSYSQTQIFRLPPITVTGSERHSGAASAIVLDWFTSGRMHMAHRAGTPSKSDGHIGEEWAFERYRSVNEIWVGDRRVARDVMLLEQHSPTTFTVPPIQEGSPSTSSSRLSTTNPLPQSESTDPSPTTLTAYSSTTSPQLSSPSDFSPSSTSTTITMPSQAALRSPALPRRTLAARFGPYSCCATLFLLGPLAQPIISALSERFATIQQMQASQPEKILWSMSFLHIPVAGNSAVESKSAGNDSGRSKEVLGRGAVVRVMGTETELVRMWLKKALAPLRDGVGSDAYHACFV
ncbi:UreD-domain-containing protein [Clavulina sp. PMI_390]|nr:UreD-domain-containing protein [Clavulina sp. PMI_390]